MSESKHQHKTRSTGGYLIALIQEADQLRALGK